MRPIHRVVCSAGFALLLAAPAAAQELFNVPVRINMGGPELTDSYERVWLSDRDDCGGAQNVDPLNIRPDDQGGENAICDWAMGNFQPDSLDNLGFDSFDPNDVSIFNTIRWDNGGNAIDFFMEIPIPAGFYHVNMYFTEGCCTGRHFKIELQGEIVDDDVSYLDYDEEAPALGRTGVLGFSDIEVGDDQILRIGLLPCPECPREAGEGIDNNAIIDALEIISDANCDHLGMDFNSEFDTETGRVFGSWNGVAGAEAYRILRNGDPLGDDLASNARSFVDANPGDAGTAGVRYTVQALDGGVPISECSSFVKTFACPSDLVCEVTAGEAEVALSWNPGAGLDVSGFEIRANGELIDTLGPDASVYEHEPTERNIAYTVTPITDPPGGCSEMTCTVCVDGAAFETPLRINLGGPELVDSLGRVWLSDNLGTQDELCIRPDDGGGFNNIVNWCPQTPESVEALGFDPTNPNDTSILGTIRWDVGGDGVDWMLELPLADDGEDSYTVTMYFNECCCPGRHFQIAIEEELVEEDVAASDFFQAGSLANVGARVYEDIIVDDGALTVHFIPCPDPDCPGANDINAICSAIEVVPSTFDPCSNPDFTQCPQGLTCVVGANGAVSGEWEGPLCFDVQGYEVRRDGDLIDTLAADATSFTDTLEARIGNYTVTPLVGEGDRACSAMSCSVVRPEIPFAVPLYINMGGPATVDSRGRQWLGDEGNTDPLGIRPDTAGGPNSIVNWCPRTAVSENDSYESLGFDPNAESDRLILNSIRWDVGDDDQDFQIGNDLDPDDIDFRLEIPVPNGDYLVSAYFAECGGPGARHFSVEVQGDLVAEDVSTLEYSDIARPGRLGRLDFDDISVTDGILRVGFLPCPDCVDAIDFNPIVNALAIQAAGSAEPICARDLICEVDGGSVTGSWVPGIGVEVTGYEVLRNGQLIDTLGADATSFDDDVPCSRVTTYEVRPMTDGDSPCPNLAMRCTITDLTCPFEAPVRLNMGGATTPDSKGNIWVGDGPGAGDPLDIRPEDGGGTNTIENWSAGLLADDTFEKLGLDPTHPGDVYIFNTIRWDNAADGPDFDFRMEIPIDDGDYDVHFYFNEACCRGRHFQIELEGEVLNDDVSYTDYDETPDLGRAGRLSFPEIAVTGDILEIGLLPCPLCEREAGAGVDNNAIIDAIEIVRSGDMPRDEFKRGDANTDGSVNIADMIFMLNRLFGDGGLPTCLETADLNGDANFNIADAIFGLNRLFGDGPPPIDGHGPDGDECGEDPNPGNSLGCEFYDKC